MIKNYIFLLFFITTIFSYAQEYKRADAYFDKMWYVKAASTYESSFKDGDHSLAILQKIADSYYFNTNMVKANYWYEKMVLDYPDQVDSEHIARYIHTLKGIKKYKEAFKWQTVLEKRKAEIDTTLVKESYIDSVQMILDRAPAFTLKNVSINTSNSDFGVAYYKDSLVYASANDTALMHTRIYHWNEQPFLNLYIGASNKTHTDILSKELFSKALTTRYHEATLSFSPDQKKVYFTRNNYRKRLKRDSVGTNHLKLYSAELLADAKDSLAFYWTNVQELPFNSDVYSVGHPSVSPDGKKLYFVSDMPGSIGATDIFMVDILEDGTYSAPKNLGTTINTIQREMFPFVTDSVLYFSSDGHLGLGALDVFESVIKDSVFTAVENLGLPLNSNVDDFGYIVDVKTNKGYVCSNREGGKGDDDIYSFERLLITPRPKKTDTISAVAPVVLTPDCKQSIRGHVYDIKSNGLLADATVVLLSKQGKELERTISNFKGDFIFKTSLPCATTYDLKAFRKVYKPGEQTLQTNVISGETTTSIGLETLDPLIVEENGVLKIKINPIYFDLNKSFIRPDAAQELNKIVYLMKKFPSMVIKIESHTDCRGRDAYNLALSDRRAKSTRAYIISQDISRERLQSAIGYGESRLLNHCKNGVRCSEEEHQLNRRSDFIIISM